MRQLCLLDSCITFNYHWESVIITSSPTNISVFRPKERRPIRRKNSLKNSKISGKFLEGGVAEAILQLNKRCMLCLKFNLQMRLNQGFLGNAEGRQIYACTIQLNTCFCSRISETSKNTQCIVPTSCYNCRRMQSLQCKKVQYTKKEEYATKIKQAITGTSLYKRLSERSQSRIRSS